MASEEGSEMNDPFDEQVELAMIKGLDVEEHLKGLTTKPDIPLGPMTTTEARKIAHEFAKVREAKAKQLMDQAEAHYRSWCDHWEACCADTYATAPEN